MRAPEIFARIVQEESRRNKKAPAEKARALFDMEGIL
jgi:hypothetical protein